MAKTIIKAENERADSIKWSTWIVEYKEFEGRYWLSNAEYQLQIFTQELIAKGVSEDDIEKLEDLARDVFEHDRSMEECD
jgi:hypothetical protein